MLAKQKYVGSLPAFTIDTDDVVNEWMTTQSWYDKDTFYVYYPDYVNGGGMIYSIIL